MPAIEPTSAAGILALLSEEDIDLQGYALEKLNSVVDKFWMEISEEVTAIEALSESPALPPAARNLAALLVSKIYYHLSSYPEALSFALLSGPAFSSLLSASSANTAYSVDSEYVSTILSICIDTYTETLQAIEEAGGNGLVDPSMEELVNHIIAKSEEEGEWLQVLGIALDSRRIDVIKRIFEKTKDDDLLRYLLDAVLGSTGFKVAYRNKILSLLLSLFLVSPTPDYFSISLLHIHLNEPSLSSALLLDLLKAKSSDLQLLTAYQIAFDLSSTAGQQFLAKVVEGLDVASSEVDEEILKKLKKILSGEESVRLWLEFLSRENRADLLILQNTKDALEARSSLHHSSLTFSNAFAHSGTSSDTFLRNNLDWLARASNWSKYSATAALGVIHKGNLSRGRALLQPYLPGATGGSPYSEGGSLYALGLIHAGYGGGVIDYLRDEMNKAGQNAGEKGDVVSHGAALGLGLAGVGTQNEDIYDDLRTLLFTDSATASESAGYAMGLVMLGSGSEKAIDEMITYAHETQHEKIIRGLAIGVACVEAGRREEADPVIEKLLAEKDAILRYGGVYTVALAYAGTSNNSAIRKVLHIAVSDVDNAVRRAAVTAIGFILFRNPSQVPRIVQLLAESYNPHVRHGAAFALGISCAGTGLPEAIELLEPMTKDPVDFVRQGAVIALSMVLIQQAGAATTAAREKFASMIADKHEDSMAKFGAAVAQGIIDAGGRNATLSLKNRAGDVNMLGIVGVVLFVQFWYWFPMAHCLSLGFEATGVICLNKDLKIPKLEFISKAKPSLYAYPAPIKPPTKVVAEKAATFVLSTTAKATARLKEKKKEEEEQAMDTDEPVKKEEKREDDDDKMKVDETSENTPLLAGDASGTAAESSAVAKDGKKDKKQPEPASEVLKNMVRVTPAQSAFVSFPPAGRYIPVRFDPAPKAASTSSKKLPSLPGSTGRGSGILMVVDTKPEEEAEYIELTKTLDAVGPVIPEGATGMTVGGDTDVEGEERAPPESFEYNFEA